MEKQTEKINLRPSTKQKRTLLKAQFFQKLNDSEMEEELIRNWYETHPLTSQTNETLQ